MFSIELNDQAGQASNRVPRARRRADRPRHTEFRPELEAIEDRTLLSFQPFSASGYQITGSAIQVNGSAVFLGETLRLTDATSYQRGSAWFNDLLSTDRFDAKFDFELTNSNGGSFADGFTFAVLDANRDAPGAIGGDGGNLGYAGLSGFAIEFDPIQNTEFGDPAYAHVGLDVAGSVTSNATARVPFNMLGTGTVNAEITYDRGSVTVFLGRAGVPKQAVLTATVPAAARPALGRVGFTGATGALTESVYINNFHLTSPVVELTSPSFQSPGFRTNGSSHVAAGELLLTDGPGQAGSAWLDDLNTSTAFTTTFDFKLNKQGTQAWGDGFTFAVVDAQVNGPNAFGAAGGGMGYLGLSGFAIEFDTYPNGEFSDPNFVHVGLDVGGSVTSIAKSADLATLLGDIRGAGIIKVEITYDQGAVNVKMARAGGPKQQVLTATVPANARPALGRVGFTGGTGGAFQTPTIDNFVFLPQRAVIYTVTTTNDSGLGSLREQISSANSHAGPDLINFNIPQSDPRYDAASKAWTIAPAVELPTITETLSVYGGTQPGYADRPVIELRGSSPGLDAYGLQLRAGNSTLQGLNINRFARDGILVSGSGASSSVVQGNYIGVDTTGSTAQGNNWSGIAITGASNVTVGGTTPADRNVVAGSKTFEGIALFGPGTSRNVVVGNFIGSNASGTAGLGNQNAGVMIRSGATDNTIGGTAFGSRNVISGNSQEGIQIEGVGTTRNVVLGNSIGVRRDGQVALPNGFAGILIWQGASGNTVGGLTVAGRNIISGNGNEGIAIIDVNTTDNRIVGNFIGTDIGGTVAIPNASYGVQIINAPGNRVGGTMGGASNLLSGNVISGAKLTGTGTTGNRIQGNFIGTGYFNNAPLGNGWDGVSIDGGANANWIGTDGATANARTEGNIIGANRNNNVGIFQAGTDRNVIAGNYIGIASDGTTPLGAALNGVWIGGGAKYNVVGTNGDNESDEFEGNVISGNGVDGVQIPDAGTDSNIIAGNLIGVDAAGTVAKGNLRSGIYLGTSVRGTRIGTDGNEKGDAYERNIISGNGNDGITLGFVNTPPPFETIIAGNSIGTDLSGTAAIPNVDSGVYVFGSGNRIGTNSDGRSDELERNLLSGNLQSGLTLASQDGFATSGNVVAGNYLGTRASGFLPLGNGIAGVRLLGAGTANNIIGGLKAGAGNLIAFNGGGVAGTTKAGILAPDAGLGNTLLSNTIHSNNGLGIDLTGDGVTINDSGDVDTGPNGLQNYPVLTLAAPSPGKTALRGQLNGRPNTTFSVQFFSSTQSDPSGFGEGQTFVGSASVTSDASGNAQIYAELPSALGKGQFITATATDQAGNTSEFSRAVAVRDAIATVGANVNLSSPSFQRNYDLVTNQSEGTVAVDPSNPFHIFAASNDSGVGFLVSFSSDGGITWSSRALNTVTRHPVDSVTHLPFTDPSAAFDEFGNLYLSYIYAAPGENEGRDIVVLLSTDGGATFSELHMISPEVEVDQPTITTGPSKSPGQASVCLTYEVPSGKIMAVGAEVTSLGVVGPFGEPEVATSFGGNYGDIAVGPSGQVMVAYQGTDISFYPAVSRLYTNTDPDGLTAGGKGFGFSINETADTYVNTGYKIPAFPPPSAEGHEGIDAEVGLAWDRSGSTMGRIYLVYTQAEHPILDPADTDIELKYSDDGGNTWIGPIRVDDSNRGSQFLPRIALDQSTGDVAVTWYDTRNDPGNVKAEVYAAVSVDHGKSFLPSVKISTGVSNAADSLLAPEGKAFKYGDYMGLAFHDGWLYPVWADNSDVAHEQSLAHQFNLFTSKVGIGTKTLDKTRPHSVMDMLPQSTSSRAFRVGVSGGDEGTYTSPVAYKIYVSIGGDKNWTLWKTLPANANGSASDIFHVEENKDNRDYAFLQCRLRPCWQCGDQTTTQGGDEHSRRRSYAASDISHVADRRRPDFLLYT